MRAKSRAANSIQSFLSFLVLSSVTIHSGAGKTRRQGTSLKLKLLIENTEITGDKYINTMTLRQHIEAGKHRAFKGDTKLDNY